MATGGNSLATAEGKNFGGYPIEMTVDEVARKYICLYCNKLLMNPSQLPCGHILCAPCVKHIIGSDCNQCPECPPEEKASLQLEEIYPDNATKREMQNIRMKCNSCYWDGLYKILDGEHWKTCPIQPDWIKSKTTNCNARSEQNKTAVPEIGLKDSLHAMESQMTEVINAISKHGKEITNILSGKHIFKIPHYLNRKRWEQQGTMQYHSSDPFLTSKYGYQLIVHASLNGLNSGKGTHISIFLEVIKGQYDNLLHWPFRQRVTFKLMNQKGGQNMEKSLMKPFLKPPQQRKSIWGIPQFVQHAVVETPEFLQDDTIFILIMVSTDGLFDPTM